MKIKCLILISFLIVYARSMVKAQCSWNSTPNPDYCCGNDPELVPEDWGHHVFNWGGSGTSNFCNSGNFREDNHPTAPASSGDWMLIWDDEFNDYSKLNGSFYVPTSQLAYNINDGGDAWGSVPSSKPFKYMQDPALIKINQGGNGKLQLYEKYNSNASAMTPIYAWGEPVSVPDPSNPSGPPITQMHSDYTVGHIETRYRFPKNVRIQADIKTYPVNKNQWPAFWTYGDNGVELDVFEMPYQSSGYNGSWNNRQTIMTYHAPFHGDGPVEAEGLIHIYYPTDLSAGLHTYELIWDEWVIQWWFDHYAVRTVNHFYKYHNSWNTNKKRKHYRALPVGSLGDFNGHSDQLFSENKHFPQYDNMYKSPQFIIFNNQLKYDETPLDPNSIDANASMDMDYLRVWAKVDCNADAMVNSRNFYVAYDGQYNSGGWPSTWIKRDYLATGGNVTFVNGSNVTVESSQMALVVATNQIAFLNGFSVDQDASLFAFISYCESAWDNARLIHEDEPDTGPDDDPEPHYNASGQVDAERSDDDGFVNSTNRTYNNSGFSQPKIISKRTKTSADNTYMNNDIVVKTLESDFVIESRGAKLTRIELYDAKGALLLNSQDMETTSYPVSKTLLPEGLYTCMIYTTAGIEVRKLCVLK